MSNRLIKQLRRHTYFKPIVALLEERGIDFEIVKPTGRGHPMLLFGANGGEHRIPLPGSPHGYSRAADYLRCEIQRRLRGEHR